MLFLWCYTDTPFTLPVPFPISPYMWLATQSARYFHLMLSPFSLFASLSDHFRPNPQCSYWNTSSHVFFPCLFFLHLSVCVVFFCYPIRLMRISYIKTPSPFSLPLHVVSSFTLGFSCITPTSKTQDPSSPFFTSMHFPPGKSRQHGTAEAYCWQCKAIAIT